jgi:hypothetical protein
MRQVTRSQFEDRVFHHIALGNVPDFMRPENWPRMTVSTTAGGRRIEATIRVCPDYLAIGSNTNFVRVPLSPIMAQRIADEFGFVLPTRPIVDLIETESRRQGGYVQFQAAPDIASRLGIKWDRNKPDGRWMMSAQFAETHNVLIEERVASLPERNVIISGIKKDVIYDSRTNSPIYQTQKDGTRVKIADRGVAIYLRGTQPAAVPHEETYYDYSHGIRFVHSDVQLRITERDGAVREERMSMRDVLRHPEYHRLFAPAPMDIATLYRAQATPVVPRRRTPPLQEPRSRPQTY